MAKGKVFDINKLSKEELDFYKNRKLKDKFFIGRFNETETGYLVSDIRRSDFSKIKYKPKNAKTFTINVNGFFDEIQEDDCYYRFTWKMLKSKPDYVFDVDEDEEIILIEPKDIVSLLYEDIYDYPASASEKIVNTLDTLKNQLTASGKEVFIYELLQNANDYPQKIDGAKQPVDVEFHITDNYLIFQHSGDFFDAKNIAAICSINDKEKTDNSEAIGYKGIGFKTVFLDNDYVLLRTGEYQFRFDYYHTKDIDDTPWQILPIWTEDEEVDEEVLDIIDNADAKYRVQIALCPTEEDTLRDGEQNYEDLFTDVFETERVILFIPFINSVSVYMDGEDEPSIVRIKENDKWCVSEPKRYLGDIPEKLTEELNRRINKNDGKIPEKYYDFKKTSIGFACKKDGNKLIPVENTCLYCYLPAKKAKWGFGFLMNTDMIPTGPRDNVEPKEKINHAIAKIAGQQFFHWIQDLLESNEYDYESIFSLIPDFEELEDKYDEDEDVLKFITEFKEGFEEELEDGAIIPVEDEDGNTILVSLNEVNYDITGITSSGLMTDDKLRKLTEWSDFFVHPDLRDTVNLCLKPCIDRFMERYVVDGYTFDEDALLDNCENEKFAEWLSDEDNNSNFLNFLLEKEYITDFKDKEIFLTEGREDLNAASNIYYDIDEYYDDLQAFDDYLPRLALCTREYFEDNETWNDSVKDEIFASFDCDNFVDNELRSKKNIADTCKRLNTPETSYGFYNFLAKNVGYCDAYKELPFIDFNGKAIDDFHRSVFFYHEDGEELYYAAWTDESWINLVSEEYSNEAKEYFKDHFGVKEFSIQLFVDDVLLSNSEIQEEISELGEEHIDFVHYCYENADCFRNGSLKDFALWTYDKEGTNDHILTEDVVFFECDDYESFINKSWIENGWMYKLDEEYFENINDCNDFKSFMSEKFGVLEFTSESFYKHVVSKHIKDICSSVGGNSNDTDTDESIDVLTYLGENYKLIFEDHNGDANFENLHLYRYDTWDAISDRNVDVYLYSEELEKLLDSNWSPEDIAYMLEERYNEVFAKYPKLVKKLDLKRYSFKDFAESLLNDTDALIESTKNRDDNIAFHRFMLNNKEELNQKYYSKLSSIHLLTIDNNGEEGINEITSSLYISNLYMDEGKGIESMVKKYDEGALFTSEAYFDDKNEDVTASDWNDYFKQLGVSYNIHDIVFNSIIPNLSEIEDVNIVPLLAEYYYDLQQGETWDETIDELCELKLLTKAKDETYTTIKEVIFNDCYDREPYPYLVIADEMSDKYRSFADTNVMRLLNDISKEAESRRISSVEDWKKEKLEWYLYCQENDIDAIKSHHVRYIQDLASDYNKDNELYERKDIKDIKLLDSDNTFRLPKDITRGSKYAPRCDFQRFGIKLTYLSETYLPFENPDSRIFWKLFADMGVVYDFMKMHLPLMAQNYDFAVYFWTEYLTVFANRTHITAMGIDEFKPYAIIPTANAQVRSVKRTTDLYSRGLITDGYVIDCIPNYEDKIALESVYSTDAVKDEILGKLDFAISLSFDDCLSFLLSNKDKSKRYKVLEWMAYKSAINYSAVRSYLVNENSTWRNGRGEFCMLKDLYLIDIKETRLRQLFGKNAKVMQLNYIESNYVFERFCTIFNIKALTLKDFDLTPSIIDEDTTNKMHNDLRLPLLIIAAITDPSDWENLYNSYCDTLNELQFHRCTSITLNYNDELMDSSIMYHNDGDAIYFVNDWMHRRVFKDIVSDFKEILEIDLDDNVLEAVFEADKNNKEVIVDQYVSYELAIDSHFIEVLSELDQNIAKGFEPKDYYEEENVNRGSNYGSKSVNESYSENESDHRDNGHSQTESSSDEDSTESRASQSSFSGHSTSSGTTSSAHNSAETDGVTEEEQTNSGHQTNNDSKTTNHESKSVDADEDFDSEEKENTNSCEEDTNNNEERDEDDVEEETYDTNTNDSHSSGDYHSNDYSSSRTGNTSSQSSQHNSSTSRSDTNDKERSNKSSGEKTHNNTKTGERRTGSTSNDKDYTSSSREYKPREHSTSSGKRKNYMGYNPDETKHRPFNVGKQEPTTLETKEATEEEISRLSALLGRAFDKDSIVDENYLVRMRFYNSVKKNVGTPKMTEKEFITKGRKYVETKNGKWVHRCSARGGILYVSPSIWNRVKRDNCIICMYYGKRANEFLYIRSQQQLLQMIDKDAVVVQVTGNDKGKFINRVYDTQFPGMNGNIYTMIRTIKTNGDDFMFDPNDSSARSDEEYDTDLI